MNHDIQDTPRRTTPPPPPIVRKHTVGLRFDRKHLKWRWDFLRRIHLAWKLLHQTGTKITIGKNAEVGAPILHSCPESSQLSVSSQPHGNVKFNCGGEPLEGIVSSTDVTGETAVFFLSLHFHMLKRVLKQSWNQFRGGSRLKCSKLTHKHSACYRSERNEVYIYVEVKSGRLENPRVQGWKIWNVLLQQTFELHK